MALAPQCVISRFIADLSATSVKEEMIALLSGFFESIGAQKVARADHGYSAMEAIDKFATEVATQRTGKPMEALLTEVLDSKGALLVRGNTTTSGLSFGVDKHRDPKSRWDLFLHRTPLPIIDLRTFHGQGFYPKSDWAERLVRNGVAHGVWIDGRFGIGRQKSYATKDNQYLLAKWRKLLAYAATTDDPDEATLAAGLSLRELCRKMSGDEIGGSCTSFHRGREWTCFIRKCDKTLVDYAGAEKLAFLLSAMGISVDQWLGAGE